MFRKIILILNILILLFGFATGILWHKECDVSGIQQNTVEHVLYKRSINSDNNRNYKTNRIPEEAADLNEEMMKCFESEESKPWCSTDTKYRSLEGHCNNMKWRTWGKANITMFRLAPAKYVDDFCAPRIIGNDSLPSAFRLAEIILHTKKEMRLKDITMFFVIFGQIIANDVASSKPQQGGNNFCCSNTSQTNEISCACMPTELIQKEHNCRSRIRSQTNLDVQCPVSPVHQLVSVSSYLDASFLYTSNVQTNKELRSMEQGKLKIITNNIGRPFPKILEKGNQNASVNKEVSSQAHFNLGTTTILTIFSRLHNFLCAVLSWMNPSWEDEQLFQEGRRLLIAMYQHVVYYEFVPVLIGYEYAKKYDIMPTPKTFYEEYNPNINPTTINNFATAAFRIFHSFYPPTLRLLDKNLNVLRNVSFDEEHNFDLLRDDKYDSVIRGLLIQVPAHNSTMFLEKIKLYANDIERGRDHGLPTYNDYRELCGFSRISSFSELKTVINAEDVFKLENVYKDVDDVDLYVGGILEITAGDAYVGPTFQCLIAEGFYRYKFADRFFYEHKNTHSKFTIEQLSEIKKVTASLLVCISSDNIVKVQSNAFYVPSKSNPTIPCEVLLSPDYSWWEEKFASRKQT